MGARTDALANEFCERQACIYIHVSTHTHTRNMCYEYAIDRQTPKYPK